MAETSELDEATLLFVSLNDMVEAIEKKAVSIDSPTITGGGDPEIGYENWPWHDEWLHYAKRAIAAWNRRTLSAPVGKAGGGVEEGDEAQDIYSEALRAMWDLPEIGDKPNIVYRNEAIGVLANFFARLRALLPLPPSDTPAAGDGWQPIETAPKDGTPVLIADDSGVFRARWWGGEKWAVDGYSQGLWHDETLLWQPLPANPVKE